MITAILVPLVILYFYLVTKKEMQKNDRKWRDFREIPEEAVVSGKIIEVRNHKERFYYHRYIHITTLKIDTGSKELNVRKITPITKGFVPPEFKQGSKVHLYGNWKDGFFSVNRALVQNE